MKTHTVAIRVPQHTSADEISSEGWFKQTNKNEKGEKVTLLFQRPGGEAPRSLGQKIIDFFSGIKRAKESMTAGEAFKGIKEYNNNTSNYIDFLNVNLIPDAINKMAPEKKEDDLHTPKPAQEFKYGHYTLKLEEM
jgi:hypothetical protein